MSCIAIQRASSALALALLIGWSPADAARSIHYGGVSDPAVIACDRLTWRGEIASANRCFGDLLATGATAARAEAAWALGDQQAANRWFREALEARDDDLDVKNRWAELFASTHQDADAMALFGEVLADDPNNAYAIVGAASLQAGRFDAEAENKIDALLEDDQVPAGARLRAALLSAKFALERGDRESADALLTQASELATDNDWPELDVLALRVAIDALDEVEDSEYLRKGLAINPSYGPLFVEAAYFLTITRHYRQAVEWLQRAVDVDPSLAGAHEQLGVNLLRDNRVGEARTHLEAAYELDPFSPVAVNTLRLLDSFDRFRVIRDEAPTTGPYQSQPPLELRLRRDEADILADLIISLTRDAIDVFTERYGFQLREPVVIELYPDHEDFAVRTAGMPGLGILGATFGYVVAMDSPSGRNVDEFQWGTVLWHELAHVFTLEATDHRVPRWYSEGISVYEEWVSGPNAGIKIGPQVFAAVNGGVFLPVAELDSGFVRPTFPNQVFVSYMQAGLVCTFIAERFGDHRLARLLALFGDGLDTPTAIQRGLGMTATEFDENFNAWVEGRFGELYSDLNGWSALLSEASEALASGDTDTAVESATAAIELYPGYVAADSAWLIRAQAAEQAGDDALVEATYDGWLAAGGTVPGGIRYYADWLAAAGNRTKAAAVLARLALIDPLDADSTLKLADWHIELNNAEQAVTTIDRLLAMEPHDRAGILFRKAQAQRLAGNNAAAQETLLETLALAPEYRDAQRLLLEIVRDTS
ncbi:MAG: tetratricopeptide repeat protein [Pseudomonadota bacterium]